MTDFDSQTIANRALEIFAANNSASLATTGGPYSPWVLGVYFANEGLSLYTFVEQSGKTIANLRANARVSLLISQNDAQKDFAQGIGRVSFLPESEAEKVRAMLVAKMPWYQTYTPVAPVRIDLDELFVSSFASGWFPAKVLKLAS
jgi:nitroimidazol reductase NimA-like FMN-containing flavoprotein (pyridoxamine 5'-phosphate oxidase superfamily)